MGQSVKHTVVAVAAGGGVLAGLFGLCSLSFVGLQMALNDPQEAEFAKTVCFDPPKVNMPFYEHAAKRAFICTLIPGISAGENLRRAFPQSPVKSLEL